VEVGGEVTAGIIGGGIDVMRGAKGFECTHNRIELGVNELLEVRVPLVQETSQGRVRNESRGSRVKTEITDLSAREFTDLKSTESSWSTRGSDYAGRTTSVGWRGVGGTTTAMCGKVFFVRVTADRSTSVGEGIPRRK
jgi:hypothetical protein